MLCLFPLNIPRPNGNGQKDRIIVPCGKCANCLSNRRNDWSIRLKIEMESATSALFITLTYDDEHIEYNLNYEPSVVKKTMQDYLKRIRKYSKFRYYLVGEYGTQTKRPHYHLLIFSYDLNFIDKLESSWKFGFIKIGTITIKSINYVTKYHVNRTSYPGDANPSFNLMSKNPAIGLSYVDKYKTFHDGRIDRAFYHEMDNKKFRLPRYLKEKIYNESDLRNINHENSIYVDNKLKNLEMDTKSANLDINTYKLDFERRIEKQKRFREKINQKNKL